MKYVVVLSFYQFYDVASNLEFFRHSLSYISNLHTFARSEKLTFGENVAWD